MLSAACHCSSIPLKVVFKPYRYWLLPLMWLAPQCLASLCEVNMFVFVNLLKRQSPSKQLPAYGHGTILLPNGLRWNPALTRKNHEVKHECKS
ncbi:phage filamentation protein Fil family protein [Pantoea agglomerans]|uniref:phage filamentation protein Fil family protein n=1 Tax=Enterobacter agglomerans TaxID=549 RepID=UPI003C7B6BD4